jgi:glycerol-3-phosphate dehydrogenase
VIWAVRNEAARTIADVLARRSRALLLSARASIEAAPRAVALLAAELGRDKNWQEHQLVEFRKLAAVYLPPG